MSSRDQTSIAARIRTVYESFKACYVRAPHICEEGSFIGVDNRQRCQYDLAEVRSRLCNSKLPLIQVVGDSGTPFDPDKISALQRLLSQHAANCLVEYGFTASEYDTNWLVAEYLASHPEAVGVSNVVRQSVDALEAGFNGSEDISAFLVLFDRLSPTRFGDDVWLSDGIMFKELGDRMLCLEGGPQALLQCTNALMRGIEVIAVTDLRSERFSASRVILEFKDHFDTYVQPSHFTQKQSNVTQWCAQMLRDCGQDVFLLIIPVKL